MTCQPIRTLLHFKPMNTVEQEIKVLRKKSKSWLALLVYYTGGGQKKLGMFSQRLRSLYKPVFKPEILQKAVQDAIPETINAKEATGIKKSIMSRLTPNKVSRRLLSYPQIPVVKAQVKDNPGSFTLGRLFITWAVLTDQSPQGFITKVAPNVNRLYEEWHGSTGCQGLSDEEYQGHEKESARFLSGICRTLIRATPEENLIRFMHVGIKALGAVIGEPCLEKEIYRLLGQASRFVTRDAAQKIESALKANPIARERIDIPELKALVLREEDKLGWSKHTEKDALKTLRSSLSPELKEAVDNDEVIRSSMEAVGRRGLFNNLVDAINGQLRPRLIDYALRWLKKYLLPKPRIIWDEEEGGNEVYKILMKGCEDGKG